MERVPVSTMAGHQDDMFRLNEPGWSGSLNDILTDKLFPMFVMPPTTMELFWDTVVQLDLMLLVPVVRHC